MYFQTGQVFLSQNGQGGSLLVFWPYSVFGQNHLYVRMLETWIPLFRVKLEEIQVPCQPSGQCVIRSGRLLFLLHPSGRRAIPSGYRQSSIIRPDDVLLPSGHLHSIEDLLCQLASVRTFQQHVRMLLSSRTVL
jgi:hypothetical protein